MPAYKTKNAKGWYFIARYTDLQGNRKQRKRSPFKTKREALDAEREFLNSLRNGVYTSLDWTVADLIDIYLEDKQKMVKASTLKGIVGSLNGRVRLFLGNVPVKDLTNAHILALHDSLFHPDPKSVYKPLQLSSAKELHSIFMAMIKYAEKHYDIPKTHHKFSPPKNNEIKKKHSMKCYTYRQVYAVINQIPEQYKFFADVMEVLYLTGMRISELLALTYSSIDLQNKKLSIHQNVIYGIDATTGKYSMQISTPKTESSIRIISIPDRVIEIYLTYLEESQQYTNFSTDWFIFTTSDKTKPLLYSSVLHRYNMMFKRLDIPQIRFHDFRHSHASLLINGGADALLVKERLGHATVTTTLDTYAHLFPEKDDSILNYLNQLL